MLHYYCLCFHCLRHCSDEVDDAGGVQIGTKCKHNGCGVVTNSPLCVCVLIIYCTCVYCRNTQAQRLTYQSVGITREQLYSMKGQHIHLAYTHIHVYSMPYTVLHTHTYVYSIHTYVYIAYTHTVDQKIFTVKKFLPLLWSAKI